MRGNSSVKRKGGRASKGASKAASPKPAPVLDEAQQDEDIIRCVCGEYEEEEDVERDMICCDECSAWQHNDCMGLRFAKGEEPDQYFCEKCKPENHRELLERMAKGEKPWEEAAEARRQLAERQRAARRKPGKRGKKSAEDAARHKGSEPISERNEFPNGAAQMKIDSRGAAPPEDGPTVNRQKRKREETDNETMETVPPEDSASSRPLDFSKDPDVNGLSGPRKTVVEGFIEFISSDLLPDAIRKGTYSPPSAKPLWSISKGLALETESVVFQDRGGSETEPSSSYREQMSSILFNLKQNTSIRDGLLCGSIKPDKLALMTTEDMRTSQLKHQEEEMQRENDRRHRTATAQIPVQRVNSLTHDREFVGDAPELQVSLATDDSDAQIKLERRTGSPNNVQVPQKKDQEKQPDSTSVPASEHEQPPSHPYAPPSHEPGEVNLPTRAITGNNIVWRGNLKMSSMYELPVTATHVAGADVSSQVSWDELIPPTLVIDGRINAGVASKYLCDLRFSTSTDVIVAGFTPPSPHTQYRDYEAFQRMFGYFVERERYGVIGRGLSSSVVDAFLVPLDSTHRPEFLDLLENTSINDPSPQRVLLLVFAIKNTPEENTFVPPDQSAQASTAASPISTIEKEGTNQEYHMQRIFSADGTATTRSATLETQLAQ